MKKSLDSIPEECKLDVALALNITSELTDIQVKEMILKTNRNEKTVVAKYISIAMVISLKRYLLLDIASILNLNHSTVLYAKKTHKILHDSNHNGYRILYERALEMFHEKRFYESKNNKEIKEMSTFEIIKKFEEFENKIKFTKQKLIIDYLLGTEIEEDFKNELRDSILTLIKKQWH